MTQTSPSSVSEPSRSVKSQQLDPPSHPRVGSLTTFFPEIHGGAEVSLGTLLEGFRDFGLTQIVLTLGKAEDNPEIRRVGRFRYVPRRIKILGSKPLDYLVAREVSKLVSIYKIGLLHVQDTYSLRAAVKATDTADVPLVLSYHNDVGIPHSSFGARYPFNTLLDHREHEVLEAAKACSAVIANSNYTATRLIAKGIPQRVIRTIYIGGAIRCTDAEHPRTEYESFHILAVGRLVEHKGLHNLLLAVKTSLSQGTKLKLVIVGTGREEKRLVQLMTRLGLAEVVAILGHVDDLKLQSLYDWSHVVAIPSITPEPFGRVAVEAMSRGRAVIASNTGGLSEIVVDGSTGFLVSPDNPLEIADKIRVLDQDRNLVGQMGRNGLASCKSRFDYRLITRQLLDVYQQLAS